MTEPFDLCNEAETKLRAEQEVLNERFKVLARAKILATAGGTAAEVVAVLRTVGLGPTAKR